MMLITDPFGVLAAGTPARFEHKWKSVLNDDAERILIRKAVDIPEFRNRKSMFPESAALSEFVSQTIRRLGAVEFEFEHLGNLRRPRDPAIHEANYAVRGKGPNRCRGFDSRHASDINYFAESFEKFQSAGFL